MADAPRMSAPAAYATQAWAVANAELRKLRHDPWELLTRAIQPILWLMLFGQVMAHVRGINTGSVGYLDFLAPGILAALLLVLVRTIAMFELTFFTAGPSSQTLVVALYYAVYAAGVRAGQSIDAMAVIYMLTTLVWLLIALRFVDPTQIVTRAKREAAQ